MRFAEALIGSLGIMVFGWLTIPMAAYVVGASVTPTQGLQMGFIFFALRLAWLYGLRVLFDRRM